MSCLVYVLFTYHCHYVKNLISTNLNPYFIQILTGFPDNLSFYLRSNAQPQNLVHHSTTWCERSLSQGSGVNWSPQSKERHPLITWAIGYQPQQPSLLYSVPIDIYRHRNSSSFSRPNIVVITFILPDLDSYRISIHSPNISGDIIGRFGGFLTDFVSVIHLRQIIFLTLRRQKM